MNESAELLVTPAQAGSQPPVAEAEMIFLHKIPQFPHFHMPPPKFRYDQ
jgi:hypothetical protein